MVHKQYVVYHPKTSNQNVQEIGPPISIATLTWVRVRRCPFGRVMLRPRLHGTCRGSTQCLCNRIHPWLPAWSCQVYPPKSTKYEREYFGCYWILKYHGYFRAILGIVFLRATIEQSMLSQSTLISAANH